MTETLRPRYQVDLVVEGKAHLYDVTADGQTVRYPGVTGFFGIISKPALVPWAKREALALVESALVKRLDGKRCAQVVLNKAWIDNVIIDAKKRPDQLKDEAADLGTRAHAFIDLIIHGREPDAIPPEIEAPVKAFKDWWKGSGIELVLGDTKVASRTHGFGGSLDALGRRGQDYVLMDFKTSSGCWPEYALQVAAYCQALEETYGIRCSKAMILRLGKKLPIEFEVKELADVKRSFDAFLAAKTLKELLEKPHFIDW